MAANDTLATLMQWLDNNGIIWTRDLIEVRLMEYGLGVFALKDCNNAVRETLVQIPKSALLSAQSSAIANILYDEQVDGSCSLALALLYEIFQGPASPWYGYLQALAIPEDLPIFWNEAERALLEGTELASAVGNDYNDLVDDYDTVVVPLFQKYPYIFRHSTISFQQFCRAMAIVTSRAFPVDRYHEDALIPFADMFNHRGDGSESVHTEVEYDVCKACGQLVCDRHSEQEKDKEEKGDASHFSEEEVLEDLEALEDAGVNFWTKGADKNKEDTCDIVLDRQILAEQELFTTYGAHSNFVLLSKFGFCYDGNKHDYISVGGETVFSICVQMTRDEVHGKRKFTSDATSKANERVKERFDFYLTSIQHVLFPHMENRLHTYYTDVHGHYGKQLITLLWIVFVDEYLFTTQFKPDIAKAIECLCQLDYPVSQDCVGEKRVRSTPSELRKTTKLVYMACKLLSEYRRREYLDQNRQWTTAEEDREIRNQVTNKRLYYALTCRISEKQIIQESIDYYNYLIRSCVEDAERLSIDKKLKPRR